MRKVLLMAPALALAWGLAGSIAEAYEWNQPPAPYTQPGYVPPPPRPYMEQDRHYPQYRPDVPPRFPLDDPPEAPLSQDVPPTGY